MSGKKRCEDCQYWAEIVDSDEGECLRFPPSAFPKFDDDGKLTVISIQPKTKIRHSCGEYRYDDWEEKL